MLYIDGVYQFPFFVLWARLQVHLSNKIESFSNSFFDFDISYSKSPFLNKLSDIQGFTLDNRRAILEVATNYATHLHPGFAGLIPVITTPTPMALAILPTITGQFAKIPEMIIGSVNIANLRENYLNPNFPEFINSKNVSTT